VGGEAGADGEPQNVGVPARYMNLCTPVHPHRGFVEQISTLIDFTTVRTGNLLLVSLKIFLSVKTKVSVTFFISTGLF
jgi:hypothetical protein